MADVRLEVRGMLLVARLELRRTLFSIRSALALVILVLMVVGGAYGMSQLFLADAMATVSAIIYKNADSVVYLTSSLTALVVPIAAVIVSFDGIVHERLRGTMDLMLVKPMSREALALGKFLGAFGTVTVQVVAVTLPALGMIAVVTGQSPSILVSVAFVVLTVLLGGAYVGISQTASALARSHGTAVMAGFSAWLLFTMFWILVPMSIAYATGMPYDVNDQGFLEFNNRLDVFNPNGAYNLYLAYASGNGFLTAGVDLVAVILSCLLWYFVPMVAMVLVFGRSEG